MIYRKLASSKSPLNVIYPRVAVRADWRATFESDRWTFVPTRRRLLQIISTLMELKVKRMNARWDQVSSHLLSALAVSHRPVQVCPPRPYYKYKFVPLALHKFPITRLTRSKEDAQLITVSLYNEPYKNFPILKSRVHPYFVIQNAWYQLNKCLDVIQVSKYATTYSLLRTIV